jgi:hypothetical protein
MTDPFAGSWLKIERANQHISDLDSLLQAFANSDFYDLTVEKNVNTGENFLRISVKPLPAERYALIIGDALHNLRSALDLAYYQTVIFCKGTPTKWTRFPVRDTREKLVSVLDSALEKQQISAVVHFSIVELMKPYETGNPALWTLDDLNIIDKHQLLIPVVKLVILSNVRFEEKQQGKITGEFIFGDDVTTRIRDADGLNLTVKDKGHATLRVILAHDIVKLREVIPTLRGIAEEVTKAVNGFEFLLRQR